MGTVGWLLVVAVGVALGFSAGRLWPGTSAKITELERERDAAREDLNTYREEVGTHFEKTAELFDKVTADYRGLYEHLAIGARQLGAIKGEAVEAPSLAEPERRRLAATEAEPGPEERPDENAAGDAAEAPESSELRDEEIPAETGPQPAEDDRERKPAADESRDEEATALMEEDARRRAAANDETAELAEKHGQPKEGTRPDEETRTEAEPAPEDEKVREHTGR
jgi:uncharacterized protein